MSSSFLSGEEALKDSSTDREVVIYWLHLDVCLVRISFTLSISAISLPLRLYSVFFQTVLAAALPSYKLIPDFLGTSNSLRDNLILVYQELRDADLNDEKNVVLAHRLLNHDFMKRLLSATSKFTVKSIKNMIEDILRAREDEKFN